MGNSYTQPQRQPRDSWTLKKKVDISLGLSIYQTLSGEKLMGREIDIPSQDYKQSLLRSLAANQTQKSLFVLSIIKCTFESEATMCSSQEKCLLLTKCPDYSLKQLYEQRRNTNQGFAIQEIHQIIDRIAFALQVQQTDSETFNPIDMNSIVYFQQKVYLYDIMMMGSDRECSSFLGEYPCPEILSTNPLATAQLDHLACNLFSVGIMAIAMNNLSREVEDLYLIGYMKQFKRISKHRLEQVINSISEQSLKNKVRILTHPIPELRKGIYKLIRSQQAKIKQFRLPLQQISVTRNNLLDIKRDNINNPKISTQISPKPSRPVSYGSLCPPQNYSLLRKPQTTQKNSISIRVVNRNRDENSPSPSQYPQVVVIKPSTPSPSTISSKKSSINKEYLNTGTLITPKKMYLQQQFSTIKQVTEYDDVSEGNRRSSFKHLHLQGKYDGSLVKGKREGFGKCVFPEGSYYEGQWKDDQMHGFGKLYYSNGALAYEGFWDSNQFNGKGKVYSLAPTQLLSTFDCRDFGLLQDEWVTYEGELVRDQKEGWGELILSNGQRYSGQFKDDLVEGEGTFWKNDGTKLVGIWKEGKLIQVLFD